MKYFLFKLIGPRPTFAQDMTAEERNLMQEHSAYWRNLLDQDIAIIFGPVMDPNGAYGLGIVKVDAQEETRALIAGDPAIKKNCGFKYEVYPMLAETRDEAVIRRSIAHLL
jgi:uncharacterized protein